MKTKIFFYLLLFLTVNSIFKSLANNFTGLNNHVTKDITTEQVTIKLEAESSKINTEFVGITEDQRMSEQKGISLKKGITSAIDGEREDADVIFNVKLPKGRYLINTYAVTDDEGAILMKKATSKYESLYMRIQIDENRPSKKVIYVPWDIPMQESGRFDFNGEEQKIKIWLPKGVKLDYILVRTYIPPKIPEAAISYIPKYSPPASRPRLWLNEESLQTVKNRLTKGENLSYWETVRKNALTPFEIQYEEGKDVSHNNKLEGAARNKAFYYLMTNDEVIGREAIHLMTNYLSRVEFDNLLDITREIGRAIYTASLVYDWCYGLMNHEERNILYQNLMRLAEEMEVGWPPFRQSILTGHGSEAQITRDLLSMGIAIYDENPTPFNYCSYRILEELVPMRDWQYQSPRHNQGVSYASFRSTWDIHAAWLFYRMTNQQIFNENIKKLPLHWLYLRLPDGEMLRDGDGIVQGSPGESYYWKNLQTMFLFYTYASDPILKGEFKRQGGEIGDAILYLLLNDPDLKAIESLSSLPLTIDFGPIIGSMVARTGWNLGSDSDDVVAEIRGGGYHFGNHQHSDAGAIQLYYRGLQVVDLGIYGFYGPPYDFNFNKRSISHSMMLAVDPNEKFGNTESNDGGTKFNQRHPQNHHVAQSDPWFNNGTILSTDFGPSQKTPVYSYFSVNLKGAYTAKIEDYIRQFCFINLQNDSIPAFMVLADNMITADPSFKKYWQINTLNPPIIAGNNITLENKVKDRVGKTHIQLLVPNKEGYTTNLLSGDDANSSFEFKYEVPGRIVEKNYPEASGHRIMISPKTDNKRDEFLTVFQLTEGETKPYDITINEIDKSYIISVSNHIVSINKELQPIDSSFSLDIPTNNSYNVLLTGLKEGEWNVKNQDGRINFDVSVKPSQNTAYFITRGEKYTVSPKR